MEYYNLIFAVFPKSEKKNFYDMRKNSSASRNWQEFNKLMSAHSDTIWKAAYIELTKQPEVGNNLILIYLFIRQKHSHKYAWSNNNKMWIKFGWWQGPEGHSHLY